MYRKKSTFKIVPKLSENKTENNSTEVLGTVIQYDIFYLLDLYVLMSYYFIILMMNVALNDLFIILYIPCIFKYAFRYICVIVFSLVLT